MSKWKLTVMLLVLCSLFTGLDAQTTVTIGTGTSVSYYPISSYDGYMRSSSIYLSSEIGFTGSSALIQSLDWNVTTISATVVPVKIYLKTTTATTQTAATWTALIADATLVYDGTVTNSTLGWQTIDITDYAYYSGNLMVLCETNFGGTGSSTYARFAYTSSASKHQYQTADNTVPTVALTVNSYRPNIRLTLQEQTFANDLAITEVSAPTTNIFANSPATLSTTIKNTSTGDLFGSVVTFNIDGLPVGTATIDYMTPGQVATVTYNWTATAGKHTYSASVPADDYNANNSKSIPVRVFRENQLVEGFEGTLFPPQYWSQEDTWTRGTSTGYGINDSPYARSYMTSSSDDNKKLITQRVVIVNGDSLCFYVKKSSANSNIQVKSSIDGINWTDIGTPIATQIYSTPTYCGVGLGSLTTGNIYYLALSPSTLSSSSYIYIDNIVGPDKYTPTVPEFSVSPISNDYGTITESFTKTQSFTIKNIGTGTLTINSPDGIKITGTDASQFILGSITYPINLARDESKVFDVVFTPTSGGAKTATIEITDNITKATHSIPLTGSAIALLNTFTENFDAVTQPALPTNWTAVITGADANAVVGTNTSLNYSAPNSAKIFNGSTNVGSVMLATPALRKIDENQISFRARGASTGNSLIVGTMTNPADAATFTAFQTLTLTNTFDLYTVNFVPYTGTDKYIAFKHGQLAASQLIVIDNVVYETAPTAPAFSITPTSQHFVSTLTAPDTKSFTITNTGTGTLLINEGGINISGTNASEFILGAITYPISLTKNQTYSFNVTLSSASTGTKSATMNITDNIAKQLHTVALTGEVANIILSENFESTTFPPTGWTINNPDNLKTWETKAATGNGTSTKAAYVNLYNYSSTGQLDNLNSPVFSLNALSSATLKFNVAYRQYTAKNDGLNVLISTDGGTNFNSTMLYSKTGAALATGAVMSAVFTPTTAAEWRLEAIDLTPYIGNSSVVLRFQSVSDYGNNLYIDDIVIDAIEGSLSISENTIPTSLTLSQNYPNPFNPSTTIYFALPANSQVELSVYNAKGELVKELVNSQLKAGVHNVTFNASGLNSGMYFYKLNTPEKSLTKKMILIK